MKKEEIQLTNNPAENIVNMAPYLSEKQQYVVLGMFLAQNQNFHENQKVEKKKQSNQNKAEL